MRDPNNPCLFCNIKESGLADENTLAYASYDTYPVSDLHCLIIPKRHVKDYFELTKDEVIACNELIKRIKEEILINTLNEYDEILLIGSGKAVTSVKTIKEINWKRNGIKNYKILSNFYKKEILKCSVYR